MHHVHPATSSMAQPVVATQDLAVSSESLVIPTRPGLFATSMPACSESVASLSDRSSKSSLLVERFDFSLHHSKRCAK